MSTPNPTAAPQSGLPQNQLMDDDLVLRVNSLKKYFPIESGFLKRKVGEVRAVDDVSFQIREGEDGQPRGRERLR